MIDLLEALEMKLLQPQTDGETMKETILDYGVLSFTETYFELQLYFDDVTISEEGYVDELQATFYGTRFF